MHVNKGTPTMPAVSVATAGCCPAATPVNEVVEDIFGLVQVLSDGTVVRSPVGPVFPPTTFPENHPSVEWKDAVYDEAKNLLVRMYKPSPVAGGTGKVPVLVHFHGGGFCIGSPTWGNVHAFCLRLVADTGAVVLSAGYRLAPEHRLTAAVDDGAAFMSWLREQASSANTAEADADAWLTEAADFGRVFVTGDSAGATIAHHLAVRAGAGVAVAAGEAEAEAEAGDLNKDQETMTVRGYVLLLPFFGGVERTPSEQAECPAGSLLSLDVLDRFWRVSLPVGATRDHPVANPFGPDSPDLGSVDFVRPVLVVIAGLDLLRDRAVDYAERLAAVGKPVELVEFAGAAHGFFLHEPGSEATGELIRAVGRFVHSCVSASQAAA